MAICASIATTTPPPSIATVTGSPHRSIVVPAMVRPAIEPSTPTVCSHWVAVALMVVGNSSVRWAALTGMAAELPKADSVAVAMSRTFARRPVETDPAHHPQ